MRGTSFNRSELARFMGKSLPTVDAWAAAGCPHQRSGRNLRFESVQVIAWLLEREAGLTGSVGSNLDLGKERARLARGQADHVALKNERLRAELLPADDAVASWNRLVEHARALLLALPPVLADEIMALTAAGHPDAVRGMLNERIRSVLEELANTTVESDEDEGGGEEVVIASTQETGPRSTARR